MNTCEYCDFNFTTHQSLKRHYGRCKEKEKRMLIIQYESQTKNLQEQLQMSFQKQCEQYETQLQKQREQYEIQIQNLKEQLSEFKTQIFEIAKQPKQINNHTNSNTHNNQKTLNMINQLAPYDITAERVQEILDSHALEKVFKDGPNSIADFVVEKILTDPDTQKPKLIATDRSRGVFKYKDTEGNVHVDNKLTKTTDILQKPLFKTNDQILLEIFKRHNYDIDNITRETFRDNTELLNCINKHKLGAQLARRIEGESVS